MRIQEIMTAAPETVTPDDSIARAAQLMRHYDVGMIPVVHDDGSRTLVGVITDRDIAVRHVADMHSQDCTVRAHMTCEALETVRESDDSDKVMEAMKRRELRRIPVIDDRGKLVGVIAQADIAMNRSIPKEEVGEVVRAVSEPGATGR